MKKLLTLYALSGFILTAAVPVLADDVIMPPWAGEDRTVYAPWGDWDNFPGPMPPDAGVWWSIPEGLEDPCAIVGSGAPVLLPEYEQRYSVIELHGDDELTFGIHNFAEGLYKEVWIQVTYYQALMQSPLFDVGVRNPDNITEQVLEDSEYWNDGWVTEAWSFQIWPNPEAEQIILNFNSYPAYVDQVVIDTMCIPEPATICFLGLGALSLIHRKR